MALSLPLQPSALSKHAGTEGKLRAGRAPWKRRSCCFLVVFKLLCLSWESLLNLLCAPRTFLPWPLEYSLKAPWSRQGQFYPCCLSGEVRLLR